MFRDLASYDGKYAKTLNDGAIMNHATTETEGTHPWSKALSIQGVNNGALFNLSDLRHLPDTLNDGVGETTSIAL